jgi:hypothetical protein
MEHLQILENAFQLIVAGETAARATIDEKRIAFSAVYNDIVDYKEQWFRKIFHIDASPWYALNASMVLWGLAEVVHRRGGRIHQCVKVMQLWSEVLECFRFQTYDRIPIEGDAQRTNYRKAAREFHITAHLAHSQMNNKKEAVSFFCLLIASEIDETVPSEARHFFSVLDSAVGRSVSRTNITKEQLRNIEDDDIWKALQKPFEIMTRNPSQQCDLKIRSCAMCAKTEKKLGRLLKCSRCKTNTATYCSKACQRLHWPTHKMVCKEAEIPTPRTGPHRFITGPTLPDGRTVVYKVFEN